MNRSVSVVAALVAALVVGTSVRADFADHRSIFVSRFEFPWESGDGSIASMTSTINSMMSNIAAEGIQHVIWQVRGQGDALYNSNIEPQIDNLTSGFDPLQTALTAAHSRGLKLHAWVNTVPLWRSGSDTPPTDPNHAFHNDDPSFRIMDANGDLEPAGGWSNYSMANPVLPEMHQHVNSVINDIAENYAVDGIHLDYIRYLNNTNPSVSTRFTRLPHDPVSHQMFADATGLDGSNSANFTAYKDFVTGRITDLVRGIRSTVNAAEISTGREIELTASVWRDPDIAKNDYMQDYRTWLQEDLLDVAMPMIYLSASNDHLFNPNLLNTLSIPSNTRVSPTVASYLHMNPGGGGVALTLSEVERAYNFGADGVGFYSYPAYFNSYSAAERAQLKNFFDSLSPPVDPGPGSPGNVIDDFEVDEGHFGTVYNHSPGSQTFGLTAETTLERIVSATAENGVGSQELNLKTTGGAWALRHNSGIGSLANIAHPSGNVPLAPTGFVGFWLKTSTPGVTVQIAIDDPVAASGTGSTALEKGMSQGVIADGAWHLYQWDLENVDHWNAFAGGANGQIDAAFGTVTIDSIFFSGTGDSLIYLDTVSHNPDGPLAAAPIPGDFNGDRLVDGDDLAKWMENFGPAPAGPELLDGDADLDGDVDGADFLVWQRNVGGALGSSAAPVPEPSSIWLSASCAAFLASRCRRRTA